MVRAFDKWLVPYFRRRNPRSSGPVHVMVAVCDHFEPLHDSDKLGAIHRIGEWSARFPGITERFRDADDQSPKHTFFYPIEQYDADLIEPLAALCARTGSEVEVHLHHDKDTPEGVEAALEKGKEDLTSHGLLSRDEAGTVRYGFIHGNWALNHSHPEGKGCGVDREIPILRQTGCYADFTMPSAPSPTQSRVVNSIAYATDLSGRSAMDRAELARVSPDEKRRERLTDLLMIQGPLALNWKRRKFGVIPRMENGDVTGVNPPTELRLRLGLGLRISVSGRPDWAFVKFHTHGGIERNFEMLLGEPMKRFHESLAGLGDNVIVHYVTAREMANMVHAAEDGHEGNPNDYRDYCFQRPERNQ